MAEPRKTWSAFEIALAILLFALAIWAGSDALADIFRVATKDKEQTHIFLVPVVSAWLLWLRRSRIRHIRYAPSLIGPVMILIGWTMAWWGYETDTRVVWHAGALLTVAGAGLSLTGMRIVHQFAPVLAVWAFAIPVPGMIRRAIAQPLQEMAASITMVFLDLFGVEATQDGNVIMINTNPINVGEACNGMRMVFALTLIVYAFVFSTPFKPMTRIVLLALSPVIALVCNVIRLVPTSFIYGYGSPDVAEMFHDIMGWVMLPIALFMLIGVLRLLKWLELPVLTWRLAETQ